MAWYVLRIYEAFRHRDDLALSAAETLIVEMFDDCSSRAAPDRVPPPWILLVRDFLNERFQTTIRLDTLALLARVHVVHLARTFRSCFGTTIVDYVRGLRIGYACRRLASSDLPLSTIAADAGFADQSHLTRTFRRFLRTTPHRFRAAHRPR